MASDSFRPDRYDLIGAAICLVVMAVIMSAPRSADRTHVADGRSRGGLRSRHGAVAKLDKAPVSKTGDSRFESWLPRSPRSAARR